MELQALVLSESEFSNQAIAITTPDGDVIPILDTNAYAIAAPSEEASTVSHCNVLPSNTELTVGTLALNVAEVFGDASSEFASSGQQVHVIQHIDGIVHTLYNEACLESTGETISVTNDVCSEFGDSSGAIGTELMPQLANVSPLINEPHSGNASSTDIAIQTFQSVDEITNEITNDSVLSFPVSGESTPSSNGTFELSEREKNANTVVIDVSKPIQLSQNSLIVVNGQKCVLQQNPESGELIAYPVKEPEKPPKRRGRPRKKVSQEQDDDKVPVVQESVADSMALVTEEIDAEKGLIETANEAGEIVKRSSRVRKRASNLNEYETDNLKFESSSDDDNGKHETDAVPSKRGRSRGKKGLRGRTNATQELQKGKRGRGRPRRYGLKQPEPPPIQMLLVQMGGQTIMIRVPESSLSSGLSMQTIAQGISESLASGTLQKSLPVLTPKLTKTGDSDESQSLAQPADSTQSMPEVTVLQPTTEQTELGSQSNDVECHSFGTTESVAEQPSLKGGTEYASFATADTVTPLEESNSDAVVSSSSDANIFIANELSDEITSLAAPTIIPLSLVMPNKEVPIRIGLKATEDDLEKFKCIKCDFQAYYQQQYQEHIATHINDVHKCKCCAYLSFTEEDIISHYKEQHPKNICAICNHTAEHASIIKRHMYRHSELGTTCDMCGKTYKDHYILRMHIKMVHTPADVLFECNVCRKKFSRKAHLKRHIRTHDPEKPYKCPHCDYRGYERSDITKHRLIHEEPKHSCEYCGKTFRHIKNRELHLKRHTGQRDYKCGVCDFLGYTFTDIRKHIERKHSDPKTILCSKCGQAFKTEQLLMEHRVSEQCELFMLEQVLLENEQMTESLPVEEPNMDEGDTDNLIDSATVGEDQEEITQITLNNEAMTTLNAVTLPSSWPDVVDLVSLHFPACDDVLPAGN